MKIVNDTKKSVAFRDLKIGDTFMKNGFDERLFMKIPELKVDDVNQSIYIVNAILLNCGSTTHMMNETEVVPVECETRIVK